MVGCAGKVKGPVPAPTAGGTLGLRTGAAAVVRRLLARTAVKRAAYVPFWAWQFLIGVAVVLLAVGIFATVVGAVIRAPTGFLDEVGRTITRVVPQQAADVTTEAELKALIAAAPRGRLRVATVDAEHGRVVFAVVADRAAVHAAVQPGDELRIARDGGVEIAPTGIPGLLDQLGRAMEELRRKWFGK